MSMRSLVAVLLLVATSPSFAATFTVTSSADSGPGTLRQAILDANAAPGRDAIVFQTNANLTSGLTPVTDPVDIDGTVGVVDAVVTAPAVALTFLFNAGSSTSTLRDVRVEGSLHLADINVGVIGVNVARCSGPGRIGVFGNGNLIGGVAGEGNAASNIDVNGDGNEVSGNTVASLVWVSGDANEFFRNTVTGFVVFGDNNRIGSPGNGNTLAAVDLDSNAGTIIEGNSFTLPNAYAVWIDSPFPPFGGATIADNTISNHGIGVRLDNDLNITGVEITRNTMTSVDLPIDLGDNGPTANDPAPDADTGPNNLQNFPTLTSATLRSTTLEVQGTLASVPSTIYRIEIYANPGGDPTVNLFLGSFDITTDAAGLVTFTGTISPLPNANDSVTSTATNLTTNDTSEVSAPVVVDAPGELGFSPTAYTVNEEEGTITLTVNRTGGSEGTVMVDYATSDGTATAPADYAAASGTLTFDPGVTTQTIVISIVADGLQEPAETFTVTLSGPTGGATLGTATATVTISADAASIPTASTWGLIALALTLALIALRR